MITNRRTYWLAGAMAVFLALMYSVFLLDGATVKWMVQEDGPVEMVGAVCFLASAVLVFAAYLRSGRARAETVAPAGRTRRNVLYLALSLVLLLGLLEEISWGQRLFHVRTPEALRTLNRQKEINLHNLEWFHGRDRQGHRKSFWQLLLNMDRLFSVFWFTLCVVVPVAHRYLPAARRLFERVRLPVVPMVFAFLFPLNYVVSRAIQAIPGIYSHGVVEAKESNVEFLFMCVGIALLHQTFGASVAAEAEPLARPARQVALADRAAGP